MVLVNCLLDNNSCTVVHYMRSLIDCDNFSFPRCRYLNCCGSQPQLIHAMTSTPLTITFVFDCKSPWLALGLSKKEDSHDTDDHGIPNIVCTLERQDTGSCKSMVSITLLSIWRAGNTKSGTLFLTLRKVCTAWLEKLMFRVCSRPMVYHSRLRMLLRQLYV